MVERASERRYSRRHQDNSTRSDRLARSLSGRTGLNNDGRKRVRWARSLIRRDNDVVIKSAALSAAAAATKMVNF